MSDIFHASVRRSFIDEVFQVMETTSRRTCRILTKRSGRMRRYLTGRYGANGETPPAHPWFGVSVEDRARMVRIRRLRETPAATRFLSAAPLLAGLGTIIDAFAGGGEFLAADSAGGRTVGSPSRPIEAVNEAVQELKDARGRFDADIRFWFNDKSEENAPTSARHSKARGAWQTGSKYGLRPGASWIKLPR